MADPNEFDDVMPNVPRPEPQGPLKLEENMVARLISMIVVAIMLSAASTILGFLTVIQFILVLINKGEPNERLADFGTDLGIWMAKAARYQTAASEVKPWPWTELD
jgi:hypothetical protein